MSLGHDVLASSLAGALRTDQRMVWTDMQLGPAHSPRPDVYAMFKSFVRPCPITYEVKVSASDFRADVTSGKWQSYLQFSSGVYFACEGDLIKATDLPDRCGLIALSTSWRVRKKAVLSPVSIPNDVYMKLLIDGIHREGVAGNLRYSTWSRSNEELKKKHGERVAKIIADTDKAAWALEDAQREAVRILDRAKKDAAEFAAQRSDLCVALGFEPDAAVWRVTQAIRELKSAALEHPSERALRDVITQLDRTLSYAKRASVAATPEDLS